MTVDTLGQPGPAQLFALARILLHGQVALGLVGSLTFVYGTIHPAQVACALFGIAAIDMKHGAMMRSYAWLVAYLLILDVVWHHFWAERLLRNYTGVREAQEMWWGLMVANTNKVCGFGMELATAIMRLCSLPVWFLLWHNGHLEGNAQVGFQGYSSLEHLKHSGGSTL